MRENSRDVRTGGIATARSQDVIIFLVTVALISWPIVVNGAPLYTPDSASYLRGGGFGFQTGLTVLQHWWQGLIGAAPVAPVSGPNAIIADAVAEAGGIRSPIYSVITYVLRGPAIAFWRSRSPKLPPSRSYLSASDGQ